MKTLREIAEELAQDASTSQRILARRIMIAALHFAVSIVPEESDESDRGFNDCRSQILTSISEAEKELNQ